MLKYTIIVGYPKTGTTSLQNLLFHNKNINFFDKRNFLEKKNRFKEKLFGKLNYFLKLKYKKKNSFDFEKNTFFVSRLIDYHITNNDLNIDNDQLVHLRKILFENSTVDKDNFIEIGIIRPGLIEKSLKNLKLLLEGQDVTILITFRNNVDFLRSRINHDLKIFPKTSKINSINDIISEKECKYPWCLFKEKCFSNCQLIKVKTYCKLYLDYYLTYQEIEKYFDKIKVNIFEYGIQNEIKLNFPNLEIFSNEKSDQKLNVSTHKISREFILSILDDNFKKNIKTSNYKLQNLIKRKLPDKYFYF
tara:strand:- start:26 stop:937 length:912 start_codon:yes stop_codon:yes gene_type:complete